VGEDSGGWNEGKEEIKTREGKGREGIE